MDEKTRDWFEQKILDRFVRYVQIDTTSDRHIEGTPSTPGQLEFAKMLKAELLDLGITDVEMNEHGYIIARIPASEGAESAPTVGFMAHYDTSEDEPGRNIRPQVVRGYDGGIVELGHGRKLDPEAIPELACYRDRTIVTTDGSTLLGGDDKAGLAEIMAAAEHLLGHPEVHHGPLELIFTPDEETGRGMNLFPYDRLRSSCCYTLDGDGDGTLETECFYACKADIGFEGKVIHLGQARGRLRNAVTMAASFVGMLPQAESPEATDERFGYYCPLEIRGDLGSARVELYLRDFEREEIERRVKALEAYAAAVEAQFPGGKVTVKTQKQYSNMKAAFDRDPRVVEFAKQAVAMTGIEPVMKIIRGGTDGSRLSEKGVPTPNIFNGDHNMHSREEWAALPAMVRAAEVVLNIAGLWAKERQA